MTVVRHQRLTSAHTGKREDFVINNNYSSRYARKLIAEDPRFAALCETRELQRQ